MDALLRRAADQPHVAQLRLVLLEAEGPRGGDQPCVVAVVQIALEPRRSDGRGEVDGVVDAISRAGIDADKLAALAHLDLLQDAQVFAPPPLLLQPDGLKRLNIRQRAAVQNRQLQVVHLNDHVVHAEADQRRQQMFGGGDQHRAAHQAGGVADFCEVASGGRIRKPSRSVRRKTIPEPAGAGTTHIETSAPLCKPTPRNSISDRIVCSG